MTPTIEEVKLVAEDIISSSGEFTPLVDYYTVSSTELQSFAQHYIEVGENRQRESDACLFDWQYTDSCPGSNIAKAISNNTGE